MHAIEKELQSATKVRPEHGETRGDYVRRIIRAVQDLSDPQWNSLNPDTQHWVNEGARAIKAKKNPEDFPGAIKQTDLDTRGSDAPKKTAPAKPEKKVEKPAEKTVAVADDKPVGAQTIIKRMMIDEPGLTVDDLCSRLETKGYKTSRLAVSTVRSDFRHSLKILIEAGKLKNFPL